MSIASIIYSTSESKRCVLVAFNNNYTINVIESVYQTITTFELINCTKYIIDQEIDGVTTSIETLVEYLEEVKEEEDPLIIITALGYKMNDLLNEMNIKNLNKTDYYIYSLDTTRDFIINENWIDVYVLTSYNSGLDNEENNVLLKTFSTSFGNSDTLLNENSLNVYNALSMLKTAYEQSSQTTLSEIQRQLNQLTLSLPTGETSITSYNTFTNVYFILRVNSNLELELLNSNSIPIKSSPCLTYV